jgi:hypothetical protein
MNIVSKFVHGYIIHRLQNIHAMWITGVDCKLV